MRELIKSLVMRRIWMKVRGGYRVGNAWGVLWVLKLIVFFSSFDSYGNIF